MTAVGGGRKSTDAIHTDATQVLGWEKFRLWVDSATRQYYAVQTANGHFVTADNAGGLTTNAIQTTATSINSWGMFQLLPQSPPFPLTPVQTLRGFFLTAVGGGGHNSGDVIHTDALNAAEWEHFDLFRFADFGAGSTYGIAEAGGDGVELQSPGRLLAAINGGRLPGPVAITAYPAVPPFWQSWSLLKQAGGTYALQTASGGILTADGGGLPGQGFRTDTELDQIGQWEQFTLVDNGPSAYIRTHAGTYLSIAPNSDNVVAVLDASKATSWRFWVFGL